MPAEPRYVLLLGPPASGKGTQAARLREELGLPHVASGDLFRENLKNETELASELPYRQRDAGTGAGEQQNTRISS